MSKLSWLTEKIKKHKKLFIFGVIGVTAVSIGVVVVNNMNEKKEQMMAMMNQTQTSKVEKRTLVSSVSATGTVTSVDSKSISANLSGMEVKSVSVEVGDMVEAGQVICVLDSEEIQENLADAQLALSITNEKTKMDLATAERNLANAQEDYVTDIERGTKDLNDVYDNYTDALADEQEAKDTWEEAKNTTIEKKAEYDFRKDLLEETKEKINSMGSSAVYKQRFEAKKNELLGYENVTVSDEAKAKITIGSNISFSQLTIGSGNDVAIQINGTTSGGDSDNTTPPTDNDSGDASGASVLNNNGPSNNDESSNSDELSNNGEPSNNDEPSNTNTPSQVNEVETQNTKTITESVMNEEGEESQEYDGVSATEDDIRKILSELDSYNASYKACQKLESEYSSLQQEVSTWQTKYNTAQQEESSAEKAYEQAVSASESQLSTYEKQQRTFDDTAKSGENSILSKNESLYSSQLNSLTSGDSEEKKIEEYQEQLQDCTVKSPISGIVTAVNVEAGDMYNGSAIVTIEDISGFEVSTEIDEYEIGKIEKGQKVIIKTNATGDEELEGTVNWISPRASSTGSEVTYTVTISVDTSSEMLRMDMTAKLSIILESKENVLTVPYEAVQEEESGKFYVEVVSANSNADAKDDAVSQMPEGMEMGEMPQMPNGMNVGRSSKGKNSKMSAGSMENNDISTRRVYVEKGIESDYYIEIISSEISEGMEIVVPSSDRNGGGMDIQRMMMNQGPMGGF